MFAVLYEIVAKPGRESEFEFAWAEVTKAIFRARQSLGSRLHTTETLRTYIAYAQWPSKDIFNLETSSVDYTPEEKNAFDRMKEASESIKVLHRMNVCDDLLKTAGLA